VFTFKKYEAAAGTYGAEVHPAAVHLSLRRSDAHTLSLSITPGFAGGEGEG
jgi:hypothetical protein